MSEKWKSLELKRVKNDRGDHVNIPAPTTANLIKIFEQDRHFQNVRFNTLRGCPVIVSDGKRDQWTDADDAEARAYIEHEYLISSRYKADDAFRVFLRGREYNPVQDALKAVKWDGKPRCESFLTKYAGADNSDYTRECSRLLFAGGVNRIMSPGCKYDCVIVLIGKQGSGKSTLCRWLALEDDFFNSAKTIAGQKGYEAIAGKWIIELEELLAVIANDRTSHAAEERAKAFLSTQSDFYRKPYDRRPLDNPRSCIFIGTTNRDTFLTDRTGNRRWYPVRCSGDAAALYDNEQAVREEIRQAWAEMLTAYRNRDRLASTTPKSEVLTEIVDQQEDAEIEDPRIGLILDYLYYPDGVRKMESVCIQEIWDKCIYKDRAYPPKQERRDSVEIGELLTNKCGCARGVNKRFPGYGPQKSFILPTGKFQLPQA